MWQDTNDFQKEQFHYANKTNPYIQEGYMTVSTLYICALKIINAALIGNIRFEFLS